MLLFQCHRVAKSPGYKKLSGVTAEQDHKPRRTVPRATTQALQLIKQKSNSLRMGQPRAARQRVQQDRPSQLRIANTGIEQDRLGIHLKQNNLESND